MKEILRITIGLTISCLIAAFLMGSVFLLTAKAKKHNEHLNVQETMFGLLGYTKTNPVPSDLKLWSVYRYVIEEKGDKYLGYMIPVAQEKEIVYKLLIITLDGKFSALHDVKITPEKALEAPERETALKAVIKPPNTFSYADVMIIAERGGKRLAYLLPSEFQGFKTFIHVMLALDPAFKVVGLEIMEHEEDPGLGGEIVQDYFKNQFRDKSFHRIKDLKVTKDPLPDEYRKVLEAKTRVKGPLSKDELESIRSKYRDQDIYALTGATISSKAVTDGVKNTAMKFAQRFELLDNVIASQKLVAAF
jgi:electron transport complex protein RnfG